MGFLDREYYRDEERGPWAAWFHEGLVTKSLFALHCVALLIQISTQTQPGLAVSGPFAQKLALHADSLWRGEVWRLLSFVLIQPAAPNLFPILWNFTLLWVAGHEVERRLGRQRFLALYLLASLVSGIALTTALIAGLNGVNRGITWVFGCTGPVTALLAFLVWQTPKGTLTFFTALRVPVWLLLTLALFSDLMGAFWPPLPADDGRRITLAGHVGGLVTATVAYALVRWSIAGLSGRRVASPQERPIVTIYRDDDDDLLEEAPARVPPRSTGIDEHLEAQLDAVLAKVAAHGRNSLTRAELDILQRASEVYRKRRR